jgi:cytochrome P450
MAFLAMNFTLPQWIAQRVPWRMNDVITNETNFLRNLCNDIVREKRQTLAESKASAKDLEADILGTMMLGGDFSDTELVDQMLTFLAAGVSTSHLRRIDKQTLTIDQHETTASALTWACYLLTLHPEYQTRLREEIRTQIPSSASPITHQDLESLPLLNGVCQEVLRLYPTVPATIRESIRDTVVAGKHVPKGTRVILCPYAINRSPLFWGDNGDEFLPERWIDTDKNGNQVPNNNGGASTNFAQITFLHGQRACIGKDFARAELRCAVAGLVGRFSFEMQDPKQEIHIAGAVTTKPVEGMNLRMQRVDEW